MVCSKQHVASLYSSHITFFKHFAVVPKKFSLTDGSRDKFICTHLAGAVDYLICDQTHHLITLQGRGLQAGGKVEIVYVVGISSQKFVS